MAEVYDLVIIGGGSAGLTAAEFGPNLGARVALVEKHRIGGDCTWTGCIPSKTLVHVAGLAHAARTAAPYGVTADPVVDMARVRDHIQATIKTIYEEESPDVLRQRGIDVYLGGARFVDPFTLQAGETTLRGKKFLLATGASPFIPNITGLANVPYVTYEQIFDNDRLPEHLIVLGAGAVGVEIAQAYRRLGAAVTLVDQRLLPREEPEVADVIGRVFQREELAFVPGMATAAAYDNGAFAVTIDDGRRLNGDMLLVATGRRPNVDTLNLEAAGVAYSERGVVINDNAQTTANHIYAAGDVAGSYQFTHYAGWQAFLAARNALLPGNSKAVAEHIPYAIFTDPEIARAGLSETEARQRHGSKVVVSVEPLHHVDRAITDDAQDGFIKVVHKPNGVILGATIVSRNAAEMIQEYSLAITHGLKLRDLAEAIHVYPTYSLGTQTLTARAAAEGLVNSQLGRTGLRLLGYPGPRAPLPEPAGTESVAEPA